MSRSKSQRGPKNAVPAARSGTKRITYRMAKWSWHENVSLRAGRSAVNCHLRLPPLRPFRSFEWKRTRLPEAVSFPDREMLTRRNECSSRPRVLASLVLARPLEILSSSAVNREVGSFASSEVNRALKAPATTFSVSFLHRLRRRSLFLPLSPSNSEPTHSLARSCSSRRRWRSWDALRGK
jgi:hypothetical protein